jgi:beta-lactam-binding protein with PASTA domain
VPADIQDTLNRLVKVGEETSDAGTKEHLSALIQELRRAFQDLETERNDLLARVSQHAATTAAFVSDTNPPTGTTATPLELAKSFRNVIDAIQTEARQTPGMATTIKTMDIEVKGLVQVNGDKSTVFVLPGAGSPIDSNSLSTLRVTFGSVPVTAPATPATVTVPDVRQKRLNDAVSTLQSAGLSIGTITEQATPTATAGTVISQQPAAGVVVAPGAQVNVVVASSAASVSVPNVVGLPRSQAANVLGAAGFQVGRVDGQISTAPAETVLQQDPKAGEQRPPGTSVNLVTARALVTVPNVVGLSLSAASGVLKAAGLQVGPVDMFPSSPPFDTVIRQSPTAGAPVAPGASVALTLGQRPT